MFQQAYRKLMISKETNDRVRLAKQFIQNKYQKFIAQQKKNKQNWSKLISFMNPKTDNIQKVIQEIIHKNTVHNRLLRKRESLRDFKLYEIIGRGAFGQVRIAKHIATNQIVAIKRLTKKSILQKKHIYNVYLQKQIMNKTNNNFLVKMKSSFQDQNYLYIAMQYVQGGDLLRLLCQKFYIGQLILAVQELHKMNYIHRDIKPDNILIDKTGHIKISDFGLSKFMDFQYKGKNDDNENIRLSKMYKLKKLTHLRNKQKIYSKVGTPDYISPQVLTEKTYSYSTDLWAIGVIMFECLFGYPPFVDDDPKEVCHRVVNWVDYLQFPSDIKASTAAKMLILGLITQKCKRLSIEQVKKHPFFQGFNWHNIQKNKPPFIPKIKGELDRANFDYFQIKNPWLQEQGPNKTSNETEKNVTPQVKSDQQCIYNQTNQQKIQFRFPGFDDKRSSKDYLQTAVKDCERKYLHKSAIVKSKDSLSKSKAKYLINKKVTQKTRPSFQILSQSNKSFKNISQNKRQPNEFKVYGKQNLLNIKSVRHQMNSKLSKCKTKTQMSERPSSKKKGFKQYMLNS